MGNKEEKTFTDLFASASEDVESNTQSFSDILKEDTNENQDMQVSDSITFDNLFDRADEGVNQNETEIISETYSDENQDLTTSVTEDSTNIFGMTNPFLNVEEESTNEEPITNPFMNGTVNDATAVPKEEPTVLLDSNIFFQNTEASQPITEAPAGSTVSNNNDPFTENPFFKDVPQISVEPNVETNPFFSEMTPTQPESQVSIFGQPTPTKEEETTELSKEEPISQSVNPFFQEEQQPVENPFFQNQINLIENELPNKPNSIIDTTKSKHYSVKVVKKKEPLIKVIIGVLSYALFIWLLLIGITLLIYVLDIKIRAAKGDYSSPTFNAYVVLTGSMLPEIKVNDVVVTKKVDASTLQEGDVITFASADSRYLGTIITHRIIKKNPPTETEGYTFQTKGDNNNVADNALVPANNIYGKVILKIPKLGYLQEFLTTGSGWIIVILIPCLTVMSYDVVKLIKGIQRRKYKNIKVQK